MPNNNIKKEKNARQNMIFGVYASIVLFGALLTIPGTINAATISRPPTQNYTGLVGYWTFDGPDMVGGTVMDRSGRGNHGDMENTSTSTVYTKGKIGQALNLDGVNDYVEVPDPGTNSLFDFDAGESITISAWVNPDLQRSGYIPVVDKQLQWGMEFVSGTSRAPRKLSFFFRESTNTAWREYWSASSVILPNRWTHVLVTHTFGDGASTQMYVDGQIVSGSWGAGGSDATSVTNNPVSIGESASGAQMLGGMIDDVRVYERALSTNEVQRLYGAGSVKFNSSSANPALNGGAAGLIGHWTFDGVDVNWATGRVSDRGSGGNNGVVAFMSTTTAPTKGKIGQAFNFDGSDDTINLGSTLITGEPHSACTWFKVKLKGATGYQYFIHQAPLQFYVHEATGEFSLQMYNNVGTIFTSYGVVTPNVWNHSCVTVNANHIANLYLNGIAVAGPTDMGATSFVGSTFLGSANGAGVVWGQLDDVRVYNKVLSSSEVRQLYTLGVPSEVNTTSVNPSLSKGDSGLTGWWTFDGPDMVGGTVMDRSGQGNHGDMENMATSSAYVKGKVGQALNFTGGIFDSISPYIRVGSGTLGTGPLTISAWIRPRTSGNLRGVIISNGQTRLRLHDGATVSFTSDALVTEVFSGDVVQFNTWSHVAAVRNASNLVTFYINGAVSGTPNQNAGTPGTGGSTIIGDNGVASSMFEGAIDDLRTYNRALSADEIRRLYSGGR